MTSRFRVFALAVAFLIGVTPALVEAQTTYYENAGSPGRNFDTDKAECANRAELSADVVDAVRPEPMLRSGIMARLYNNLNETMSDQRAASTAQSAFAGCLADRGWTPVTMEELRQRERAQAANEAARAQANNEAAIATFKAAKPEVVTKWDEFTRDTTVSFVPRFIPNSRDTLLFAGGAILKTGPALKGDIRTGLIFRMVGAAPVLGPNPKFFIIADSGEAVQYDHVTYARDSTADGTIVEDVLVAVSPYDFRYLGSCSVVRARLGDIEFTYPPAHLAAIAEIGRLIPPMAPPHERARKRIRKHT